MDTKFTVPDLIEFSELFRQTTESHIITWDFTTDICTFTNKDIATYNETKKIWENYSQTFLRTVYCEDKVKVRKEVENCISGKTDSCRFTYRKTLSETEYIWLEIVGQIIVSKENHRVLIAHINNIGERRDADNKTGLLRESAFIKDCSKILADSPDSINYVMRIDIDNFREINERDGKEAGDIILKELSHLIKSTVGSQVDVYSIQADEFIIVDAYSLEEENPAAIYYELREKIVDSIRSKNFQGFYTISAGVVTEDFRGKTVADLMTYTEFAVRMAKKRGKNKIAYFDTQEYDEYVHTLNLRKDFRVGIINGCQNFTVYYQPIVDANTYKIIGAEALLRYNDEKNGSVSPVKMIPILEDSGLIIPVGRYVLREAIKMCKKWRETIPVFHINVNLSYVQILKSKVLRDVESTLADYNLPPEALTLEVTESGFLEMDERIMELFRNLKDRKINIAIDDFGTGYSNLRYLDDISAKVIKFDRSFTSQAVENNYDYIVINHIVDLAHSIGSTVCIEGIENQTELDKMKTIKPDMIQGYFFGKPVPASEFESLIKKQN